MHLKAPAIVLAARAHGENAVILRALTEQVKTGGAVAWEPELQGLRASFKAQPLLPLLPEIREALPDDGILSVDVHGIGYATFAEYPVLEPRRFLYPCIGVSLGHAFPAALGAKIAHPDRPVICFSGDGGFMMGCCELATAMRYGIDVVTIVVNDGRLTAIKGAQRRACEERTIDTDLSNPDFTALARSFGAWAECVEDLGSFKGVLEAALAARRPAVVEVRLQDRSEEEVMGWIGWLRDGPLRE